MTSLKACDWSAHIFGASASPRSLTKKTDCRPLTLFMAVSMIPNRWHSSCYCKRHSCLTKFGVLRLNQLVVGRLVAWLVCVCGFACLFVCFILLVLLVFVLACLSSFFSFFPPVRNDLCPVVDLTPLLCSLAQFFLAPCYTVMCRSARGIGSRR